MTPWSIRPGERLMTAALAGYFFSIVAALCLMEPARNALFLEGLGADRLPYAYIATAFATGWVVMAYLRVVAHTNIQTLVQGTLAVSLACLAGFWFWLPSGAAPAALAFYVWVKVYAVLLPSQFWLLSEEYLDPRQARRLFGPIGAGGIAGGIVGSAAAAALAGLRGTHVLLVIAGLVLVGALVLLQVFVGRWSPVGVRGGQTRASGPVARRGSSGVQPDGPLSAPHSRALVTTICAVLLAVTMAHTIVDWQFNKAAELAFATQDARAVFFAGFFTVVNVVTLAVQMFATSFVLQYFGLGAAIALLPAAIAVGAVGILAFPGLWATSLARGGDDTLRLSVDQSGRELLFLPFSSSERHLLKPRIDLIATRAASGLGGALILAAIWLLDDALRYLSVVSLLLVVVWAALIVRARRQYAHTLVHLLRVRDLDATAIAQSRLEANARDAIRSGLTSGNRDTIHAAVALAEHTDPAAFVGELHELLRTSDDADLKGQVLHLLTEANDRSALQEALANLEGSDGELTAEALAYACATGDPAARGKLDHYLAGANPLLAVSAGVCLLQHSDRHQQAEGVSILQRAAALDGQRAVEVRIAVADVIRQRPEVNALQPVLASLLADEAPQVARAALAACARQPDAMLVPAICTAGLARGVHGAALQTLQAMDRSAVGPLTGLLADPRNSRAQRCFAARALGRVGGTDAAGGLIAGLVAGDRKVRNATLKALNHMRRRGERLSIGREREAAAIAIEWRDYLSLHRLAAALDDPGTHTPVSFVATVVNERLAEAEEQVFRALALHHPVQAVFFAYRGLITGDRTARARAIELIDSIVETPERRALVRLLETESRSARGSIAAQELGRDVPTQAAALKELLDPGDPWLAACAIRALVGGASEIGRGLRQELNAQSYPPLQELLDADV